MPRYRCVERCFWNGQFYSPFPDGMNFYEGEGPTPKSKKGKEFFVCVDPPAPKPDEVKADAPSPAVPTREWELKRMSKHDLLTIMEKKYATPIKEDAVTRDALVQMIVAKQATTGETNQDLANVLKG